MKIIGIDDEKCIKCQECVNECPFYLLESPPTPIGEKRKILFKDDLELCIECGHCISVCPTNAIIFEAVEEPKEFEGVKEPKSLIEYNDLMKILRSRRSIRRYKDKEVAKEEIKAILEAMRYAPSASNAQEWKYLVITDPQKIDRIRKATINLFKTLIKAIKIAKHIKFLLPKNLRKEVADPTRLEKLNHFIDHYKKGEDPVLFNAPVLIVIYAPMGFEAIMDGEDAGIAFTYGQLAAQSIGLGTCWMGFVQSALSRSKKLKSWLGIPKQMEVTGAMIIGYPNVKFHRVPPREKLDVRWL